MEKSQPDIPFEPHTRVRKHDPQTSRDAAESMTTQTIRAQHRRILHVMEVHGHLTSQEISDRDPLGLDHWQVTRRMGELENGGYVIRTQEKRKNRSGRAATVWAVLKEGTRYGRADEARASGRAQEDVGRRRRSGVSVVGGGAVVALRPPSRTAPRAPAAGTEPARGGVARGAGAPRRYVDVVMKRGPGPDSDFVELEDDHGRGVGEERAVWVPCEFRDRCPEWRLRIYLED